MILPSCYVKNFFIHFSNFHISYIWKNIIYFSFSPSFYLLINFHYFYTFHLPSYLLLPSISCSHIRLHSIHTQRFQCTSHIRTSGETIFIRVCCSIPFLAYTTLSLHTRQSNAYTCARVQLHFCG